MYLSIHLILHVSESAMIHLLISLNLKSILIRVDAILNTVLYNTVAALPSWSTRNI